MRSSGKAKTLAQLSLVSGALIATGYLLPSPEGGIIPAIPAATAMVSGFALWFYVLRGLEKYVALDDSTERDLEQARAFINQPLLRWLPGMIIAFCVPAVFWDLVKGNHLHWTHLIWAVLPISQAQTKLRARSAESTRHTLSLANAAPLQSSHWGAPASQPKR